MEKRKIWAVDSGAYENNYISWLFDSEGEAREYADERNREEEAKAILTGRQRSMDSHYDVSEYWVAASAEAATADDEREEQARLARA